MGSRAEVELAVLCSSIAAATVNRALMLTVRSFQGTLTLPPTPNLQQRVVLECCFLAVTATIFGLSRRVLCCSPACAANLACAASQRLVGLAYAPNNADKTTDTHLGDTKEMAEQAMPAEDAAPAKAEAEVQTWRSPVIVPQ